MTSIRDRLSIISNILNSFENNDQLFQYILRSVGEDFKNIRLSENIINGCIGKLYLSGELVDGKLYFKVNGDSKIVQGFGKILCYLFSGATPAEILEFNFIELEVLKYKELLTSSRQNGFKQMYIRIRNIAQSHHLTS